MSGSLSSMTRTLTRTRRLGPLLVVELAQRRQQAAGGRAALHDEAGDPPPEPSPGVRGRLLLGENHDRNLGGLRVPLEVRGHVEGVAVVAAGAWPAEVQDD